MNKNDTFIILAIESSTDFCSISLIFFNSQGLVKKITSSLINKDDLPSSFLIPAIESLLISSGCSKSDLNAVAFGQGPGKFTGLRLSCITAKAIGFSLSIPVIPVSSLYLLAFEYKSKVLESNDIVISALDAKMQEAYVAVYFVDNSDIRRLCSPVLISIHDLPIWLANKIDEWKILYKKFSYILIGDLWKKYDFTWTRSLEYNVVDISVPGSENLAKIAKNLFLKKEYNIDINIIEPLYVRDKVAFTSNELLLGKESGNPKVESLVHKSNISIVTIEDIENIFLLDSQVQLLPWSRNNFLDSIKSGYYSYKIEFQGKLLGFFVIMLAPDLCHLLRISVSDNYKRMGIGSKLLEKCIQISVENNIGSMIIEVSENNYEAINFYRKHNFFEIGKRNNYYVIDSHKTENAIVMQKNFNCSRV